MLRFLTAGESHGPELTAIVEGFPAGLPVSPDDLQADMARRQKAYGAGGRMGIEQDRVRVTAGVMGGQTTGGPIALTIHNKDWANWAEKDIPPLTIPRPGHADLTGAIKYGYRDVRLALERASARETAARVAVGALCKHLLREFAIQVGSYVTAIGKVSVVLPADMDYSARFAAAEADEHGTRCPDPDGASRMKAHIYACMQARNTVGGILEIVALGVPPGLGSHVHWDRKLEARLLWGVCSIPAIKGAEIGPAFENATRFGTEVHDEIIIGPGGVLTRASNRAGGFEGGITTGMPIVVRAAMKPISTTLTPMRSVNLATGEAAQTIYERSDFCAVPRAGVVGEAMVAILLTEALLEKVGGDSLAEIAPRVQALRHGRLEELPMDHVPWRFRPEGQVTSDE
ncbi:MAG: chorismate synthase [Chloroflexaceae bacterium]|nr:chorismate synthase [Chloroflexaceae bacterium]